MPNIGDMVRPCLISGTNSNGAFLNKNNECVAIRKSKLSPECRPWRRCQRGLSRKDRDLTVPNQLLVSISHRSLRSTASGRIALILKTTLSRWFIGPVFQMVKTAPGFARMRHDQISYYRNLLSNTLKPVILAVPAILVGSLNSVAADRINVSNLQITDQNTGTSAMLPNTQMMGLDAGFPDVYLSATLPKSSSAVDQRKLNEIGEILSRNPPAIGQRFNICRRGLCVSGRRIR